MLPRRRNKGKLLNLLGYSADVSPCVRCRALSCVRKCTSTFFYLLFTFDLDGGNSRALIMDPYLPDQTNRYRDGPGSPQVGVNASK